MNWRGHVPLGPRLCCPLPTVPFFFYLILVLSRTKHCTPLIVRLREDFCRRLSCTEASCRSSGVHCESGPDRFMRLMDLRDSRDSLHRPSCELVLPQAMGHTRFRQPRALCGLNMAPTYHDIEAQDDTRYLNSSKIWSTVADIGEQQSQNHR